MTTFIVGMEIMRFKAGGTDWVLEVEKVDIRSPEEIAENVKYNDGLGNYDPQNERQTSSLVVLIAKGNNGDEERLFWNISGRGLSPHISRPGWTKGLFSSIQNALIRIGSPAPNESLKPSPLRVAFQSPGSGQEFAD